MSESGHGKECKCDRPFSVCGVVVVATMSSETQWPGIRSVSVAARSEVCHGTLCKLGVAHPTNEAVQRLRADAMKQVRFFVLTSYVCERHVWPVLSLVLWTQRARTAPKYDAIATNSCFPWPGNAPSGAWTSNFPRSRGAMAKGECGRMPNVEAGPAEAHAWHFLAQRLPRAGVRRAHGSRQAFWSG